MTDKDDLAGALAEGLTAARAAQRRLAAERQFAQETMRNKLLALFSDLELADDAARSMMKQLRAALDDPAKIGDIRFEPGLLLREAWLSVLAAAEHRVHYLHLAAPDEPEPPAADA